MAALYNAGRRLLTRNLHPPTRFIPTTTYSSAVASPVERKWRTLKIADRIVRFMAIDHLGDRHPVMGLTGYTLLRALCDAGLIDRQSHPLEDISACHAHCEVRIAQEYLDMMPPRSADEIRVLRFASPTGEFDKHARLGCQVILKPHLEGMVVVVPEPQPYDTF